MSAPYYSLTVELAETAAERVEDLLNENGALGLEVRDSEAPPMPGVRGPPRGESIVIGFFDSEETAKEALREVGASFPEARAVLEAVEQQDWSNNWKSLIRSVEVGRLWVGPPWERDKAPAHKQHIVIEPKMAFGTGDHPTTLLCLEAVDAFVPQQAGCSMLDVGTGTGVLALAAKTLGAGRVVGIDNDSMSVALANENSAFNHIAVEELSGRTLSQISGVFDLVVANILANTLVELAPEICAKVGQRLHLAGVLASQRDEVADAYLRQGLTLLHVEPRGEWIRLDFASARVGA